MKHYLVAVLLLVLCWSLNLNAQLLPVQGQVVEGRYRTVANAEPATLAALTGLGEGEKIVTLRRTSSHAFGDGSGQVLVYSSVIGGTPDNGFLYDAPGAGTERFIAVDQSVVNVKTFGAVGDGSNDDTIAINTCLAKNRGIYFPSGTYKVTSSLVIPVAFKGSIYGDGPTTILSNAIVANPANPLFLIGEDVVFVEIHDLEIVGNGLTGASGNGHAISLIDTPLGAFSPQRVNLSRVNIRNHRGNGKDNTGATMPAAGVYVYQALNNTAKNVIVLNCNHGWYLDGASRFEMTNMSGASLCPISGITCRGSALHTVISGCDFTDNGTAGAGNGNIVLYGTNQTSIFNNRIKSGTPHNIDAAPTTAVNTSLLVSGNSFSNVEAGDNVCIKIGNGMYGCAIKSNLFEYANAVTSATPIDVVQALGGWDVTGLEIIGNYFSFGDGMTVPAAIRLNVTSNTVKASRIANNSMGSFSGSGSALTITNGIHLAGNSAETNIAENTFVAGPLQTIATAVNIAAGAADTVLRSNSYDVAGGAITTQVANLGTRTSDSVAPLTGSGTPNGAVTANPGRLYISTAGGTGTTLYIKETGTGTNTGWVPVAAGGAADNLGNHIATTNLNMANRSIGFIGSQIFNPGLLADNANPTVTGFSLIELGGVTPVTNFVGGVDRQALSVVLDSGESIQNTANIATSSGGTITGPTARTFTLDGSVWREVGPLAGGAADNLGNHIATTTLSMSNQQITGIASATMNAGAQILSGSANPEGSVTAAIGSIYFRTTGGNATTLYVKETLTGNTGWIAYGRQDNLGNHTATTTLNLNTQALDGATFDVAVGGRITQLDGEGITYAAGTGTPEGVVTAAIGSIFNRTNGAAGTTLYVKESNGTGNTGWTPMVSGGDNLGNHIATTTLNIGSQAIDGTSFDLNSGGRITQLDGDAITFAAGSGTPLGVVTASPGSIYFNTAGGVGTTIYEKQSGVGTTAGWVGIAAGGAADNLGNHIATTTLAMTNQRISTLHLGTDSSPSMSFNADGNTGIYSPAADQVAFSAAGQETIRSEANKNYIHNAMVHEYYANQDPDVNLEIDVADKSFIQITTTGSNSVDYFTNGVEGQILYVMLEGDDTIIDSTGLIELSANTNWTPNGNAIIQFIQRGTTWYEISRNEFQ